MTGTIILLHSEAGINILFRVASNFAPARENIITLLSMPMRTSSTIMAGLLAVSPTFPVDKQEMMDTLPQLRVDFRSQRLIEKRDGELTETPFKEL